ncbi:MAG: methyltransferase domain-containing protein [Candidatus Heimdallarchaeota archaeon]
MTDSKEYIKKRYAKALEKAHEKNTSCCDSSKPAPIQEESACCSSKPILLPKKQEIVIPSFGSTSDLAKKANLKEGDVVVDFGSGPGHDLLSAAKLVGKKGKTIGIDFTPEMIEHATDLAKKMSLDNVEVKQGDIANVPLEDNIADVVISNCVINLSANKYDVFKEAFRILKLGGRLVDSDIIAAQELPESLRKDKDAWCGCIGGALTQEGYVEAIKKAGFSDITVDIESERTGKIKWEGNDYLIHSGIIRATKPE